MANALRATGWVVAAGLLVVLGVAGWWIGSTVLASGRDPASGEPKTAEQAAAKFGLQVPGDAADVSFWVDTGWVNPQLALAFRVPCGSVDGFLAQPRMPGPLLPDYQPQRVDRFARSHGWQPGTGAVRGANTGPYLRGSEVMVVDRSDGTGCAVFYEEMD